MARQSASILKLNKRPCRLGGSINTRTEKHGDEDAPACDIPVEGLMLDRDELEALLGKGSYVALFINRRNSGMSVAEPTDLAKRVKTLQMTDKFIDSRAKLLLGIDGFEVLLEDELTVSKIKLEPQVGGLTACALTLQCCAEANAVARLYAQMGSEISAEIRIGKKDEGKNDKQKELALKPKGKDDDETETEDDDSTET